MSTSSTVINQNIEIITVLCKTGVTFSGILAALQLQYPTTGWDSTLLQTRLDNGIRQGLFIAIGNNPAGPVLGYRVNPKMLKLNWPKNSVYEPFCSNVIPQGCADSCSSGSATGTGAGAGSSS